MKLRKIETVYNDLKFVIEDDLPEVGAYLYIFKNNECLEDYLQNNIDLCKDFALNEFGVPLDSWQDSKEDCFL